MDLTINASFSSVVSAITLDEAIRASSHRHLDVKKRSRLRSCRRPNAADAVATSTAAPTTARATGSRLRNQDRDLMMSPLQQSSPRSPRSHRYLYKTYSERSELSSTIRTDEGDGEDDDSDDDEDDVGEDLLALYKKHVEDTVGGATRSSSSSPAATDDDNVKNFQPNKRISRFDLVCPRRGSDEILIPPRHDLFDDDYDDDDGKEIGPHGPNNYVRKVRLNDVYDDDDDDEEESGAIERDSDTTGRYRYDRAMLSSSIPTEMNSRPWMTEEEKKVGRTWSGDMAPTLPKSSRERGRFRAWDHTGKDTAPRKPRSRSLDDFEDDPSPNMSNSRENTADLKVFASANLPLMKPTRQLTIDWDNNPKRSNDTLQRFEGMSPDAMKALRASVLPVSKPVRQKSVGLCRRGENADDQPNSMDGECHLYDEDKSFHVDVESMRFKPANPAMLRSKASLEDSSLAGKSKANTRMSSIIGSTRRRSLGPLCTVSPKSIPKRMRGTDSIFNRSQLDSATGLSLGVDGERPDAGQDVLDGDDYNPPAPKKLRRHSTPWMMSRTRESDGTKKNACNGAAKNAPSTLCIEQAVATAATGQKTAKNCDPSNFPTSSVPPSSPCLSLASVTEHLKGDTRFDPMGASNHSMDVMVMMKPPLRQASNRELTQGDNRTGLCLRHNNSFADLSSPTPPKMPKRQESFPDLYSMSSDKEDDKDDYD